MQSLRTILAAKEPLFMLSIPMLSASPVASLTPLSASHRPGATVPAGMLDPPAIVASPEIGISTITLEIDSPPVVDFPSITIRPRATPPTPGKRLGIPLPAYS